MSTEGLVEHVRAGIEFSKTDGHQFVFELPRLLWVGGATPWSPGDSAVLLCYVTLAALPLGAICILHRGRKHLDAAIATKTAVLTILCDVVCGVPAQASNHHTHS